MFAEEDGEGGTKRYQPPRRKNGQRQGEQQCGDEDAAVAQWRKRFLRMSSTAVSQA